MRDLKKVINKYKYRRVVDNKKTVVCEGTIYKKSVDSYVRVVGFLLGEYLYLCLHQKGGFTYYRYFIGRVGGFHQRADHLSFQEHYFANPF